MMARWLRFTRKPLAGTRNSLKKPTDLSADKRIKLTMTLLVRNEEDLIEENIRFHHSQGVDSFIVMDNLSTDRTAEIVQNLCKEIDVEYLHQPEDDYSQSLWVTAMARKACFGHHADWVINNDADEFWVAESGSLKDILAEVPLEVSILNVVRHNAVLSYSRGDPLAATAHPKHSDLFERVSRNNLGHPLPRKCIHRASKSVEIAQGNHAVEGLAGRTIDIDHGICILHYPYRSLDQYRCKISLGGAAYERNQSLAQSVGATWREHYKVLETAAIEDFWRSISKPESATLIDYLEGNTFRERSVADFIESRWGQYKEKHLQTALADLCENTNILVEGFMRSQAELVTQFPEAERKRFPIFYNLPYCLNGPMSHRDRVSVLQKAGPAQDLCSKFSEIRDIFSLFPRNSHVKRFLREVLSVSFPDDFMRLHSDCTDKRIVMHVSCTPRLGLAEQSIESFSSLGDGYHHLIVVGGDNCITEPDTKLSLRYDGRTLTVPVPDDYESLHRKIFYALTVIGLVGDAELVLKIDDNIRLGDEAVFQGCMSSLALRGVDYAGRSVGSSTHQEQWHGWHLSKCKNADIELRGYQYPLPSRYAAGGYGYVLGRRGVDACTYMYLAMKAFFSMPSVGLEDAYIGHAIHAQGLGLHHVASDEHLLAFPGLTTTDAELF